MAEREYKFYFAKYRSDSRLGIFQKPIRLPRSGRRSTLHADKTAPSSSRSNPTSGKTRNLTPGTWHSKPFLRTSSPHAQSLSIFKARKRIFWPGWSRRPAITSASLKKKEYLSVPGKISRRFTIWCSQPAAGMDSGSIRWSITGVLMTCSNRKGSVKFS